jgi:hypothetical protein
MGKILSLLLIGIMITSLAVGFNIVPVFAVGTSFQLTDEAKLTLIKDTVGDCYHFSLTYTYTIYVKGESCHIYALQDNNIPSVSITAQDYTPPTGTKFYPAATVTYTIEDITDKFVNGTLYLSDWAKITVSSGANPSITVYSYPGPANLNSNSPYINLANPIPTVVQSSILPPVWFLGNSGSMVNEFPDTQIGAVILNATNGQYSWLSDQTALPSEGVSYASGTWTLVFHTPDNLTGYNSGNFSVNIGDAIGTLKTGTITSAVWSGTNFTETIQFTAPAFTVGQGHHLELQVTNNSAKPVTVVTCYKVGGAYLQPPPGSPTFPLPELAAGLLLGAGLLTIGGLVIVNRRKSLMKV